MHICTFNNNETKHPKIEIIPDSLLNPLKPSGLSKHNNVVARNHPGANTEDIKILYSYFN